MSPNGNLLDLLDSYRDQLRAQRQAGDTRPVEVIFGNSLRQNNPTDTCWLLRGLLEEEARLAGSNRQPVETYIQRLRSFCPECTDDEMQEIRDRLQVLTMPMVRSAELPQVGDTLGGYRLVDVLGQGGMGVVFRAERIGMIEPRPQHIRPVYRALKIIAPGHAGSTQARENVLLRFVREADLTESLSRVEGVVSIEFAGRDRGIPFYVMNLVEGESLRTQLNRTGPFPPQEAARIVEQLARIVERVNQRGVVHRDLKPENVMIADNGTIHLVDFGIAAAAQPLDTPLPSLGEPVTLEEAHRLTQTGVFVGTVRYAAPERFQGVHASPVSEVFSLGTMLYELITGHWGEAEGDAARRGCLDLRPLRNANVPEHLEAVCRRALTRNPQQRIRTAGELAVALSRTGTGQFTWSVDPLWSECRPPQSAVNCLRDQSPAAIHRCAEDAAACAAQLQSLEPNMAWFNSLLVAVVECGVAAQIRDTHPNQAAVEQMRQAVQQANPWMRAGEVRWVVDQWLTLFNKHPVVPPPPPPPPPPTLWQRVMGWFTAERKITWVTTTLMIVVALLGATLGLVQFWGWERLWIKFQRGWSSPLGFLPSLLLVPLAAAMTRPRSGVSFTRALLSDGLTLGCTFLGGFTGGLIVGEMGLMDWHGLFAGLALYTFIGLPISMRSPVDSSDPEALLNCLIVLVVWLAALVVRLVLEGLNYLGTSITGGFAGWIGLVATFAVALGIVWEQHRAQKRQRGSEETPNNLVWLVLILFGVEIARWWWFYGDLEQMVYHPHQPTALAVSPHHPLAVIGDDTGRVTVHDAEHGFSMKLAQHEGSIRQVVFSPNGRMVAATSDVLFRKKNGGMSLEENRIWVADLIPGDRDRWTWEKGIFFPAKNLALLPSLELVVTHAFGYQFGYQRYTPLENPDQEPGFALLPKSTWHPDVAYHPRGEADVISVRGVNDRQLPLVVWNARQPPGSNRVGWIDVGETEILRLMYLPDGEYLLTGEGDGRVRLWHVASGTEVASFNTGSEPVQKLALSPDGSRFAVAGPGSHVQVWDIASASQLKWVRFGDSKVVDFAFLDNQRLLVLGVDKSIRRYRLPR